MFFEAAAFNYSLCTWGSRISNQADLTRLFVGTSCKYQFTPANFGDLPIGPFCQDCCCRPDTVQNKVIGPFELPLVPAAVSNLPDGRVLAWAGDFPYEFDRDYDYPNSGTFTSIFNPTTKNSTVLRVESKFDGVAVCGIAVVITTHSTFSLSLTLMRA